MVVKLKHKVVIAGANFGALTVLGYEGVLAFCVCRCGKELLVNPKYLLSGFVVICDRDNYNVFEH